MTGLGISLSIENRRLSGSEPATLRIVPNGATSAFVIAPHDELGAIAYKLTFANGGDVSTPPSSIGAPFGGWRWTGTHHLASVDSDPTAPIATLHDDIGSTDSALQANFGFALFGGHYHGGIVLSASDVPDLTTERYVPAFSFGYTGTISWPTGGTAAVSYELSIQPDGNLAGSMEYTSQSIFSRAFLSMVIANAFDQYSTDGETFIDASDQTTYPLDSATGVILRQGATGYEIDIETTGQDTLTNVTNEITNNGNRLKHYVRVTSAGEALGTVSLDRTIAFRLTEPDPVPTFSPITLTFEGVGDPPEGMTRTHGPNGGTTTSDQVDGMWQVRAGAGPVAPNRWVLPLAGAVQDGVTTYQVEIDYNSIAANTGMVLYVTRDGVGSTSSGNQLPFSGGSSASALNMSSSTPTTATITFTLPADAPDPHLTFDASNLAGRGVDILEIRITEL